MSSTPSRTYVRIARPSASTRRSKRFAGCRAPPSIRGSSAPLTCLTMAPCSTPSSRNPCKQRQSEPPVRPRAYGEWPVIAKVEPLTSARALRGPFDYVLTGAMSTVGIGSVVMVPFARRQVLGVVVDLAEQSELPLERLATPLRALEADVPPELVRLGLWVGEEYCSTPARGLALVLPPGTGTGAKQRVKARRTLTASITEQGRAALVPPLEGSDPSRLGVAQLRVLEA